jgi:hypothetical protein
MGSNLNYKHVSSSNFLRMIGLVLLALVSCSKSTSVKSSVTKNKNYQLLSVEDASKWVIKDEKEQFFEKVAPLEMSIQMQEEVPEAARKEQLDAYKKMLQKDLLPFSKEEKEIIRLIFDKALDLCYKIDAELKLPEIVLIKTKGAYYGPSVFYTRDNAIVIPASMIPLDKNSPNKAFLSTMIHEIFHVYSRYNKQKRSALYQRIGFEQLPNIALSSFLKKRVLYNPDGVDLKYAITVKDSNGRSFKAIPAIYSKHKSFKKELPVFFGYLTFQLFEVGDRAGLWSVKNKDVGYSVDQVNGFWEQIGSNTRYIIHPDEICADNFVILALSKEQKATNLKDLSEDGQTLVRDFENIIKAKNN